MRDSMRREPHGLSHRVRNRFTRILEDVDKPPQIVNIRELQPSMYENSLDRFLGGLLGVKTGVFQVNTPTNDSRPR